ncbi:MAG: CpaF family protein [Pirellulaceae bacterium]|nr:CpaF family protein [Pirellulaceae bacterium]
MDLATLSGMKNKELRSEVRRHVERICEERSDLLNLGERERLISEIMDETFGLGPLESLMRDPTVSDILINGPHTVYVERRGKLERSKVSFHDDQHVIQIVQRIAGQSGRRIDETSPMVDARLPDGSRLNAVIAPLALDGPLVSIRRFGTVPVSARKLLEFHSITEEMLQFLIACVQARTNILISGGTGSGKTTLLNCLSSFIPHDERVATIEDAAELQLQQPHVARMETRAANVEGKGEITCRDLVRNALRMRPDRIIVGECRGKEALDMLQAMNTGHEGSLTTIHANTPRDAIGRLEMMVGMAGFDMPIWVIRRQIASAIHVVVQAARLMGGVRKVTRISEITGMEGDVLAMHDLFEFKATGLDDNRVTQGDFWATGIRPTLMERMKAYGTELHPDLFERRKLFVQQSTNGAHA